MAGRSATSSGSRSRPSEAGRIPLGRQAKRFFRSGPGSTGASSAAANASQVSSSSAGRSFNAADASLDRSANSLRVTPRIEAARSINAGRSFVSRKFTLDPPSDPRPSECGFAYHALWTDPQATCRGDVCVVFSAAVRPRPRLVPAARGQPIVKTRGECPAVAKQRRRRETSRTAAGRPAARGGQAVERPLRSIWLFDRSDERSPSRRDCGRAIAVIVARPSRERLHAADAALLHAASVVCATADPLLGRATVTTALPWGWSTNA